MTERRESQVVLALRGKNVEELRSLAHRFLDADLEWAASLSKDSLQQRLSEAASEVPGLVREIKRSAVAMKPSFYVMVLAPGEAKRPSPRSTRQMLRMSLARLDEPLRGEDNVPAYRGFRVERVQQTDKVVEIELSWDRVHWYWGAEDVVRKYVYEFQFGFAILDFGSRKAILACHTDHERRALSKAIGKAYAVKLTPLVLTKPILDRIGKFDQVRRAGYFISAPDPSTPHYVTYADDELSAKSVVRAQEESARSQRKHSFYLIPLGSILEQGLGASSDSGKLWVPREVPLDTVRKYGLSLLNKIGATLDGMAERGEVDQVLAAFGLGHLPAMSSFKPRTLREEVCRMAAYLINLLVSGARERAFTPSEVLVEKGVPRLFDYPRLELRDSRTDESAFWRDAAGESQLLKPVHRHGKVMLLGHPSKEEVDLSNLRHPITGVDVELDNFLPALHLVPKAQLREAILEVVKHGSHQLRGLASVVSLPFSIQSGRLILDVDRAFGRAGLGALGVVVSAEDISDPEMRRAMRNRIRAEERPALRARLVKLGEKCDGMSDDMCGSCLADGDRLCLRSLFAKYIRNPFLLAHKGIEISDVQGTATVGGEEITLFGFAKVGRSGGGLTLRNDNGAKLLAQVISQLDRPTFNTAAIISPSTINQDLRETLRAECGLRGKRMLVIDSEILSRLLKDYEEQAQFDSALSARQVTRTG